MTEAQTSAGEGKLLWEPSAERAAASRMSHFMRWLERETGQRFGSYAALWQWSVSDVSSWLTLARYFDVELGGATEPVVSGAMPDAHWFPGATLSYPAHLLRRRDDALCLAAVALRGGMQQRALVG